MTRILLITCMLLIPMLTHALPYQTNEASIKIADGIDGRWNDFDWRWVGYNSQSNTWHFDTDLSSYTNQWAIKVSNKKSDTVYLYWRTNQINVANSTSIVWNVGRTNMANIPNGNYKCEMAVWESGDTNVFATICQGVIKVIDSLYDDDDSTATYVVIGETDPYAVTNVVGGGNSGTGSVSVALKVATITFPASGGDAEITALMETSAGGLSLATNTTLSGVGDDDVLAWDSTDNRWENQDPLEVALSGGTLTGDINFGGKQATNAVFVGTAGTDINEFSTDGTLGGNSDDAAPTEKATKTYVDAWGLDDVLGSKEDSGGLTISNTTYAGTAGVEVNEFSSDGTLGGNSDAAAPTEKAVKTYADTTIGTATNALVGTIDADTLDTINSTEFCQTSNVTFVEAKGVFDATDISGAEAETLTDGSDASSLHTHASIYQPLDTDLTNLANSNQSEEIIAFFDTTDITGAEAQTLTAGVASDADSLHTHDGLITEAELGTATNAIVTDYTAYADAALRDADGTTAGELAWYDGTNWVPMTKLWWDETNERLHFGPDSTYPFIGQNGTNELNIGFFADEGGEVILTLDPE